MRGVPVEAHIDQIREWAKAQISDKTIAERLGANWESVSRIRRKYGLPRGTLTSFEGLIPATVPILPARQPKPDETISGENLTVEERWAKLLAGRRYDEPGMMRRR